MNPPDAQRFGKCLLHALRTPDGIRRQYILPYTGNLLVSKFEELAERLKAAVGHHYPNASTADYIPRLKSQALTGRYKELLLYQDGAGLWNLKGDGFSYAGYEPGYFVVLDKTPVYSDC